MDENELKKRIFIRTKIILLIDSFNKVSDKKIDLNDVMLDLDNKDIIYHIQSYCHLQNEYKKIIQEDVL